MDASVAEWITARRTGVVLVFGLGLAAGCWTATNENAALQATKSPPSKPKPLVQQSNGPLLVQAESREYGWVFRYAGKDRRLDTPDDILSAQRLRLPADRQVRLLVTSVDYICTFEAPELQLRKVAVPGIIFPLDFQTGPRGRFEIVADPMCGMRFLVSPRPADVVVESPRSFEGWRRQQEELRSR